MAERGILDTCVLIDLERLRPESLPDTVSISCVSIAELAEGVHVATDAQERGVRLARLQAVEATLQALPFDGDAARAYGHLVAQVIAAGQRPRPRRVDLMIAATAYAQQLPLYTRNPTDFSALTHTMTIIAV